MSKRVVLVLSLILALVLSACATAPAQQAASSDDGAMASDLPADAAAEQILNVTTGSTGANSFDFFPMAGGSDNQSWMPLLYVPPMYFDVNSELQPGIFASWESSDDTTVWTFTIDSRAQWSDGTPITADQVVGTWTRMARPETGMGRIPQYIGNVVGFDDVRNDGGSEISGLEAVDDSTVQVTLSGPDAIFNWRIATTHMNPIKIDDVNDENIDSFWLPENSPAVSGPYMLEKFDPDLGEASFVPNPNWWMDEGPYLERINMQFVTDQNTAATMVQSGQIDFTMAGVPTALRDQFPAYFRTIKAIGFNSFWIAATVEPTNDPKVREALLKAINYDEVHQAAFPDGGASRATQLLDPNVSCYQSDKSWHDYDPEGARAALAASSYGSAENLPKLRVTPRSSDPALNRAMEAVLEFWRQNLGIENVEFKTRPDEFGDDAELVNISRDDVVIRFPDGATYGWVGMHSAGPVARGEMMRGYSNPEVDRLLEEALVLSPDDPGRCEKTQQAQELFMNDYQGIFFSVPETYSMTSGRLKNFERGPDVGLIAPWRIYLSNE